MLKLSEESQERLRVAVARAGQTDQARDRMRAIYEALQVELDARRPRCDQSGRCCRFEEYGHRLFVTTLELAWFATEVAGPWDGIGCPYQVSGLCSVHAVRPFGCRVYFCDPTSSDWQQTMYERFHAQIKSLHDELGVAYLYVEWRQGLNALGLATAGDPRSDSSHGPKRLKVISSQD